MRLLIVLLAVGCCHAQTISAVLNAASYSNNLAPGTWAAIFGTNLAASVGNAPSVPLPNSLGGVSVTVGGISAPLLYVSPTQVNALIPFELPQITGGTTVSAPLVLTTSSGSATQQITLQRTAPGIFTLDGSGKGNAIVLDAGFHLLDNVTIAPIILYATGLGPVGTPVSSAAGATQADATVDRVSVQLGEQFGTVLYAGLAPGLPGIYQINVMPSLLLTNTLYLQTNGSETSAGVSNIGLTFPLAMGTNISNATATIVPVYPTSSTQPVTYSELPVVAAFGLDMDINPNASPFDITMMGPLKQPLGVIHVNPAEGTWQASIPVPPAAARAFDFSASSSPVYDLSTCVVSGTSTSCNAFPGNIVPQSRIDPAALSALNGLPLPNQPGTINATYTTSGSLPSPPNRHLDINSTILGEIAKYGYFIPWGVAPLVNGSPSPIYEQFELFVDGRRLAVQSVPVKGYDP